MIDLDRRWYNGLTRELGLSKNSFQLNRPCAPLPATDLALWEQLDAVPPATLIFDRSNQEVLRFSQQHEAVIHRLGFGDEAVFQRLLGAETYRKWSEYASGITPRPALTQLPSIFLNWAMLRAPNVATTGASSLAKAALTAGSRSDYEGTFSELYKKLLTSGGKAFALQLAKGDSADSPMSPVFAGSAIRIEVRFDRYTVWPSKPGRWFDAAGMRTAFQDPMSPRWSVGHGDRWEDFFGAQGKLASAIESVLVVDGISVTVNPDAVMDPEQQAEARRGLMRGVWPFYVPDSEIARNSVEFGSSGALSLTLAVKPGYPVVIGNNVVGIGRYLGIARR